MRKLISIKQKKIFKRNRSYIGIVAIVLMVIFIQAGTYLEGQKVLDFVMQNLRDTFLFQGNLLNGYLTTYINLNTLYIHLPLLVVIVTGDLIAGESNAGTFRLLLTRPVSRSKILTAKFISGSIYAIALVFILAFLSLLPGIAFFGRGDLMVIGSKINIFEQNDVMWRFLAAFSFGLLSMVCIAALSFLLSLFSSNSLGPVIATMSLIIIFTIISEIDITIFRTIRPFLFSTYMNSWRLFFEIPLRGGLILKSASVLCGHIIVFYICSLIIFRKKSILS